MTFLPVAVCFMNELIVLCCKLGFPFCRHPPGAVAALHCPHGLSPTRMRLPGAPAAGRIRRSR